MPQLDRCLVPVTVWIKPDSHLVQWVCSQSLRNMSESDELSRIRCLKR